MGFGIRSSLARIADGYKTSIAARVSSMLGRESAPIAYIQPAAPALYILPESESLESKILYHPSAYRSRSIETQQDLQTFNVAAQKNATFTGLVTELNAAYGADSEYRVGVRSVISAIKSQYFSKDPNMPGGAFTYAPALQDIVRETIQQYNALDLETGKRQTNAEALSRINRSLSDQGYEGPKMTEKDMYALLSLSEEMDVGAVNWKRTNRPKTPFAPVRARDMVKGMSKEQLIARSKSIIERL